MAWSLAIMDLGEDEALHDGRYGQAAGERAEAVVGVQQVLRLQAQHQQTHALPPCHSIAALE